ncbi:30S ribosomal protein S19e [Candidatus Woesearchaeota archaeon CG08_land_8_20_14_0_20_47_9]|nr:MAG: 30S ribosomal protein S19e [Candidatus Woesearchaeota archaeon CG1_02_47_18]PIN76578.1 MAG: 30S ribosomal protein S19e [Candidatus Woesearchaeota archaeon CG10_big_fil_rev_8_21_14_0_10_47_5]PIO03572.1 MAG: 30S ribosomal protein S19e [Candidatus Woesearchaeota archaeon CG08_land_8_20_14_0_20_47_9]HII29527.1 30S ribosomal protein S19e [Candidatus Woesearchaeota archaeon]
MVDLFNVEPTRLIEALAEELKKISEIKPPKWAGYVKTGCSRERTPTRDDWWYIRAAAIMRSLYKLGPIGISKLRTKYGGKCNSGHKSAHFRKGSGSIIRKILQQLEASGLVKKTRVGVHSGRVLTPEGIKRISEVATLLSGAPGHAAKKTGKGEAKKPEKRQTKKKVGTKEKADENGQVQASEQKEATGKAW